MNISISIHDIKEGIAKTDRESTVERSLEINIDLYSAGWFDRLIGCSPELPHLRGYWECPALGYREYCCDLIGVSISVEEMPQDGMRILMAA